MTKKIKFKYIAILILCTFLFQSSPVMSAVLDDQFSQGLSSITEQGQDQKTQSVDRAPKPLEYAPGQLIIKLKPGCSMEALKDLNTQLGVMQYRKAFERSESIQEKLDKLKKEEESLQPEHQSWYWQMDKNSKEYQEYMARLEEKKKVLLEKMKPLEALSIRLVERQKRASVGTNTPNLDNIYVVEFDPEKKVEEIAGAYKASPNIEYAEPNYQAKIQAAPLNDPFYSSADSWRQGYDDLWGLKRIHAPEAWETFAKDNKPGYELAGLFKSGPLAGQPVIVAVIDTGVDYMHPDLTEDTNGNGILDPSEDMNGNGKLDPGEDLNGNMILDKMVDLNHDGVWQEDEVYFGEDVNKNGYLDRGEDGNLNGRIDPEDQNGNEELDSNIWVNAAEIPNNGIDDDQNGYIDDYYGFNFADSVDKDGDGSYSGGDIWHKDISKSDPRDDHGHGTHVAGTIAALGNNNRGIIGVAPRAKIMALKALSKDGAGYAYGLCNAIKYAADNGADIINASWGGRGGDGASYFIDAINYAISHGVVFVAAAGNDGGDVQYNYPAGIEGAISVASIDHRDEKSSFSNWLNVDVTAPGGGDDWYKIMDEKAKEGARLECDSRVGPYILIHPFIPAGQKFTAYLHKGPWGDVVNLSRYLRTNTQEPYETTELTNAYSETHEYSIPYTVATKLASEYMVIWMGSQDPTKKMVIDNYAYGSVYSLKNALSTGNEILSLTAYGTMIGPTAGHGQYCRLRGTSMASPHVAGVAALIVATYPDYSPATVRQVIRNSAEDIGVSDWDTFFGYGLIDAKKAVMTNVVVNSLITNITPFEYIKGKFMVQGIASSPSLDNYKLACRKVNVTSCYPPDIPWMSENISYGEWQDILISAEAVISGDLGEWDTTKFDNGIYQFAVFVKDKSGIRAADYRFVYVEQRLEDSFHFGGKYINVVDIDNDGKKEVHSGSKGNLIRYSDGALSYYELDHSVGRYMGNSPQVYWHDLDKDGDMEMIYISQCCDNRMKIAAFHHDGTTPVAGWNFKPPFSVDDQSGPNVEVIDDINGDGYPEIMGLMKQWFYIVDHTGRYLPGWPIKPPYMETDATGTGELALGYILSKKAGLAVGDVDGDGTKEVLFGIQNKVYIYKPDGTLIGGKPIKIGDWDSDFKGSSNYAMSFIALADMDKDGKSEIVVLMDQISKIYCIRLDGTPYGLFPISIDVPVDKVAIGDINNDNYPELVVTLPKFTKSLVAFDHKGELMPGWPVDGPEGKTDPLRLKEAKLFCRDVVIADVDGNGSHDIVVDDVFGRISIFNSAGQLIRRFPEYMRAWLDKFHPTLVVTDLDDDGKTDILNVSRYMDYSTNIWNLGTPYNPNGQEWPIYQHDDQHTGNYEKKHLNLKLGDLSGDGKITSYDAALALKIAARGNSTADELKRGDVNGDGKIGTADAVLIGKKAVGLIDKFPIEN